MTFKNFTSVTFSSLKTDKQIFTFFLTCFEWPLVAEPFRLNNVLQFFRKLRTKRLINSPSFRPDDVIILQGYPKQVQGTSLLNVRLAVKMPGDNNNTVISREGLHRLLVKVAPGIHRRLGHEVAYPTINCSCCWPRVEWAWVFHVSQLRVDSAWCCSWNCESYCHHYDHLVLSEGKTVSTVAVKEVCCTRNARKRNKGAQRGGKWM